MTHAQRFKKKCNTNCPDYDCRICIDVMEVQSCRVDWLETKLSEAHDIIKDCEPYIDHKKTCALIKGTWHNMGQKCTCEVNDILARIKTALEGR